MYLNNKQSVFFALVLLSFIFFAFSCEKQESNFIEETTYKGTFYITAPNIKSQSVPVSITLNNGTYSCSNGENFYPAGGSGTYNLLNNNQIEFTDTNVWTANFDWGLILNGDYNIVKTDENITLTKSGTNNLKYVYVLNVKTNYK